MLKINLHNSVKNEKLEDKKLCDLVGKVEEGYVCRSCPSKQDAKYEEEVKLAQRKLSMFDGFPYQDATIQQIWERFESKFGPTGDAKDVFHVWKAMVRETLELLVEDNIQYAELRTGFGNFFEKNGTEIPFERGLEFLETEIESFRKRYSNFYGVNLILTGHKVGLTDEKLRQKLDEAEKYFKKSKLVRGFDLVGYEETGPSIHSLVEVFLDWKRESGSGMPFVFHAGETLWTGTSIDENVLDATMLLSKRIGKLSEI